MIIFGIDPGTARTGFGVVSQVFSSGIKGQSKIKCLDYGVIWTNLSLSSGDRLKKIYFEISKLIKKYKPDVLVVENIFFFKNIKTAMAVSQSKGVVLLAAAKKKIPVCELSPLEVKAAITGYGRATKKQMQKMVKFLLKLEELPKPDDAADALALAICGASLLLTKNYNGL